MDMKFFIGTFLGLFVTGSVGLTDTTTTSFLGYLLLGLSSSTATVQVTADGAERLYYFMQVPPKIETYGHRTVFHYIKTVGNTVCTKYETFGNTSYQCEITVPDQMVRPAI